MVELGYLDFIFLGVIIITTITGFLKGFAKEFCGFLGMVCGIFFASRFAYDAGEWFSSNVIDFSSDSTHTLIGFIAIFLMIVVVFFIIGKILDKITSSALPNYLNKLLGAFFGGLKSFLILAFIFHLAFRLDFMQSVQAHWANNSKLYSTMENIASSIISSKLIRNAPKDSQEVKQEIKDLKEKALQGTQELGEKLLDKTKQTLEGITQDSPTPLQPQTTPQEGQ